MESFYSNKWGISKQYRINPYPIYVFLSPSMNSPCTWIYPQFLYRSGTDVDGVYRDLDKRFFFWNLSPVPSVFYRFTRKNAAVNVHLLSKRTTILIKQWLAKKNGMNDLQTFISLTRWRWFKYLFPFFSPLVLHAFVDPVGRWFRISDLANEPFDDVIPHSIIYVFCFA